jgi:hypothetical protein
MYPDRKKLPVFHQNNFEEILKRFKLWKKFENNELECAICGSSVRMDSFGCIFLSREGNVNVACSNPECLERVYELI